MYDLIVVQAFGDISHIDRLPTSNKIILLCYHNEIHKLLKEIYPGKKLVFISIGFNEIFIPQKVLKALRKIRLIINQLQRLEIEKIFTFSNGFDWVTPMLAKKIGYKKPIQILDLYNNTSSTEKTSLKAKLKARYLYLISGIKFGSFTKQHYNPVTFHNIQFIEPSEIIKSREYRLRIDDPEAIIFIDSPVVGVVNYKPSVERIIKLIISNGHKVYFKPHPRLTTYFDFSINPLPPEIPIEFIDLSKSKAVIGIASAAMYNNNAPRTISIINYFEFSDQHLQDDALRVLRSNNVELVENIEEWLQS